MELILMAMGLLLPGLIDDPAFPAMDSCYVVTTANSTGTGFLVDGGFIVTAAHVVEGQTGVVLESGAVRPQKLRGEVIRVDHDHDLALIRPAGDLDANPLALSEQLPKAGDTVYTVGSPIGQLVASRGVILDADGASIYASVPVDPGSSGGPLLSAGGQVLGVVVQEAQDDSETRAIPVGFVRTLLAGSGQDDSSSAGLLDDARPSSAFPWLMVSGPIILTAAVAAAAAGGAALSQRRRRARMRIVITLDERY